MWNNAGFLLSDEIVGLVHNLMTDYQNCDFATFRSRLLELVNGQSEIKGIVDQTMPSLQEMQEDIEGLKEVYEQMSSAYQEDKYPSVILSEDELARLAEMVIHRFDESVKNDILEGVSSKIKELTEKKEVTPVRTENSNYSQKINQLLTVVNNIQQQNHEMAEKIEELQNRNELEDENEASRMQEDNRSLLQALNKYKAAYIALKNERNDLAVQLEKLKKENFLRIRRKELQDALIEQKENEIAKLKEELAGLKSEPVQMKGSGISRSIQKAEKFEPASQAETVMPAKKAAGSGPADKAETHQTAEKAGDPKAVHRTGAAPVTGNRKMEKEPEPDVPAADKASVSPADKTTSRAAGKIKSPRMSAKAGISGQTKEEENPASEKQAGDSAAIGTGIERAKKR